MGSPEPVRDEELVRRIRAGDASAADVLFDRYRSRLHARARGILRGLVRRKVGESDVVQDACLGAFLSLDDFEDRGEGSFGRWLDGILRNKAEDQVRRFVGTGRRDVGREVTRADPEVEPVAAGREPTPSLAAMAREGDEALETALASLPDDYREVLRMVHRSGMSLAAIGQATGRTPSAVSKLHARALRALSRAMGARGR